MSGFCLWNSKISFWSLECFNLPSKCIADKVLQQRCFSFWSTGVWNDCATYLTTGNLLKKSKKVIRKKLENQKKSKSHSKIQKVKIKVRQSKKSKKVTEKVKRSRRKNKKIGWNVIKFSMKNLLRSSSKIHRIWMDNYPEPHTLFTSRQRLGSI